MLACLLLGLFSSQRERFCLSGSELGGEPDADYRTLV